MGRENLIASRRRPPSEKESKLFRILFGNAANVLMQTEYKHISTDQPKVSSQQRET